MSLHKRTLPSGKTTWEVRWREDGRNRSRSFTDRQAARDFNRELDRIRQAGELADALIRRRLTIAELAEQWWERRHHALSTTTRDVYAVQLDLRILSRLGTRRVTQLTVQDVETWITDLRARGDRDPTITKALTVLSALLTMAVQDGVIAVNPVHQARKPSQARTRTPVLVHPDQVEQMRHHLLQAGDERSAVLLELLAYAGLRPESEAVTLPWRHVRRHSLLVVDRKRARERTVELVPPLADTLNEWRLRRGRPGADLLVVPSRADGAWTRDEWRWWRRGPFTRAATSAGLPQDTRPRDLRSSFVSLLIHEGRSITEVARQLGHDPQTALGVYAQVFDDTRPEDRLPAAELIARARSVAGRDVRTQFARPTREESA